MEAGIELIGDDWANQMKQALITGITGQDGAYLAQLLLNKGYHVIGVHRRTFASNFWRLQELGIDDHPHLHLVDCDLGDMGHMLRILENFEPDEVYNLAAQSSVITSLEQPEGTLQVTGIGALRLLEAIRIVNPAIRFYQASTSEMFGNVKVCPQDEHTAFYPRSPYAIAKLCAHWLTVNYRENYDIFAASGILFNHESPLRGIEFVTRKITDGIAKIALGQIEYLELGNLEARRDWGYAREYVEGMWRMLQHSRPDTFVLATGRTASIREFVEKAALNVGMHIEWEGSGSQEIGKANGKTVIRINPKFYRKVEVDHITGNPEKAKRELGWEAKTTLEDLSGMMMRADLSRNSARAT